MRGENYTRVIQEWCATTGMLAWSDHDDKHVEIDDAVVALVPGGDIPSLEFSEQAFLFLSIGGKWGLDMPWDVPIQTKSQPINVTMKPGQTGIPLPLYSRGIKFSKPPIGLMLDGIGVKHRKTYSTAEAARMVYTGTGKDGKFIAVTSVSLGSQAKL